MFLPLLLINKKLFFAKNFKPLQRILYIIICQIKRDKTFHLRNSKKLLMVFGNLVIF